jgi:alpha-galactosidase
MNRRFHHCVVFALGWLVSQFAAAAVPTPEETTLSRNWIAAHFGLAQDPKDPAPFFSFVYGGKPSAELLKSWNIKQTTQKLDDKRTERTLTFTDPQTALEIRCTAIEYADFPAVDWVLHLSNRGDKDTPILEQIRPLDWRIEAKNADGVAVHHSLGDSNSGRSFAPVDDVLTAAKPGPLVLAPVGGRSSDGHMPYFNLDWRTGGIAAAVGWSGQWEADFQIAPDGAFRVRAGQQLTHLKLHPGETIRTPRILFVFWSGDNPLRGNNLLRQVTLAHYSPRRADGLLVFPPICACVGWTDENGCYEQPHVQAMKPMAERGIEVLWSDMDPEQWYPGGFPQGTGTWEPDPAKYPNGLKPVGDAAKAAGVGYLLWFEPERVHPGTKIDREHPEFVMKQQGEVSNLFRIQDETARKWLTDHIDVQITAAQLAWLRWDFNVPPLGFWRRNDEPDRQGITEIRYIEGLYAMWDDLRARHPGMMIDNCASGGRRIDLETCSRSVPLWHSDMQCFGPKPAADQLQNGGLTRWVPLHGCGNFALEPSYVFRSAMTAGNALVTAFSQQSLDGGDAETAASVKRTATLYRQLRPLMTGDFYPLLPHDESESQWYGYQFDHQEQNAGCVVVFRREKSAEAGKSIPLHDLDPNVTYEITNLDTGEKSELTGRCLLESGLPVTLTKQPDSALIMYKKK